jgi:hypothetical protein
VITNVPGGIEEALRLAANGADLGGSVTHSGNQERLVLPIARHLVCSVSLPMIDDAEALYELVLERRRLIRRLEELNEILFENDLRVIEPNLRRGSSIVH